MRQEQEGKNNPENLTMNQKEVGAPHLWGLRRDSEISTHSATSSTRGLFI